MVYMAEVKLTMRLIDDVQGVCMARDSSHCHNCKYYGDVCQAVRKLYNADAPKNIYYQGGKTHGI